MKIGTILGTAAPVRLVYHAVPQCAQVNKEEGDEKSKSLNDFVNRIYSEIDLSSQSKFPSSSEFEFLSSTDPSEEGLSEREVRKRTDPDLLAPIPGPASQLEEVQKLWGQTARDSLDNILTEFDDLFMKYKADIGAVKLPNIRLRLNLELTSRRSQTDVARESRARQPGGSQPISFRHDPTLAVTLGEWDRDGQEGEWGVAFLLQLCPLDAVTIKYAYPHPRIDENLSSLGKAKIYNSINLTSLSGKYQYAKQTGRRRYLLASWVCLNSAGCPLGCVTLRLLFNEP